MADSVFSKVAPPPQGEREPLVIIPGDEDQRRGYRIGKWRQYPNHHCIYCQYSTLWIEKMEKHQLEGEHPWAFPGQNPIEDGQVRPDRTTPDY